MLTLWCNDIHPFDEREMAIVTAFAGQAVMAVNNVELVQELESRSGELAKKVEELEVLREVGEVVRSSLDADHVLLDHRHARRCVRHRWGLDHGVLEQDSCFMVRSASLTPTCGGRPALAPCGST